jgi:hypothetical protein
MKIIPPAGRIATKEGNERLSRVLRSRFTPGSGDEKIGAGPAIFVGITLTDEINYRLSSVTFFRIEIRLRQRVAAIRLAPRDYSVGARTCLS